MKLFRKLIWFGLLWAGAGARLGRVPAISKKTLLVNTKFSLEMGGANGIPPQQVAEKLLAGLTHDTNESWVGQTAQLCELQRASPAEDFAMLNS